MDKNFQIKIRKLFETLLNLENELPKGHSLLPEYIENNSRTAKIDKAVYKCKIALEKAIDVNEQLFRLAEKTENPEKTIAQQDLWLKKVSEMNDKVMQEAQSYKMSLRHSQHPALQGPNDRYNKHPHARTKQELQMHEYLKTGLRPQSKESRNRESRKSDKCASTRHTSTVHTMSSSEKRHELVLVK